MENTLKKIVFVDDNETYLTIVRNQLKSFYEVFPAPSAIKLFTILGNLDPDMILLDIDMPGMNGFDVIKAMKENPRYKDIPVVFLTAKDDESDTIEGLKLGAVDYITKPISGPLLLQRISNIMLIEKLKSELQTSYEHLKELREHQAK